MSSITHAEAQQIVADGDPVIIVSRGKDGKLHALVCLDGGLDMIEESIIAVPESLAQAPHGFPREEVIATVLEDLVNKTLCTCPKCVAQRERAKHCNVEG